MMVRLWFGGVNLGISKRRAHEFVKLIGLCCVSLCGSAQAQVVSLDQNYTVSLFASGLQLPNGGLVYRAGSNDFLETQEDAGLVSRIDAATGVVSQFADVKTFGLPVQQHWLTSLAVNSAGEVFVPVLGNPATLLRFSSTGAFLGSFSTNSAVFDGGPPAFDSGNNFYMGVGSPAATIMRFANGNNSPTVYASGFSLIAGLTFNSADQMFAVDWSLGNAYQVTPGGSSLASHKLLAGGFTHPNAIKIDPISRGYYVACEDGTVRYISSTGEVSTFATGFAKPRLLPLMPPVTFTLTTNLLA